LRLGKDDIIKSFDKANEEDIPVID
jgi:hypothetical protein